MVINPVADLWRLRWLNPHTNGNIGAVLKDLVKHFLTELNSLKLASHLSIGYNASILIT